MQRKSKKNNSGQGLIEYLIISALIAVACIGIVRVLGHTISIQFANITNSLQGVQNKIQTEKVSDSHYKKRDLSNFMSGASSRD